MEITVDQKDLNALIDQPLIKGLLESISDGAIVISLPDRRIAAMNSVARQWLDYRRDEALGCQCKQMMNSPACTLACPLSALMEGRKEQGRLDLFYRGKEGNQLLHAHTRMVLIKGPDGTPIAGVELFRDLRESKRMEKTLRNRASLNGVIGKAPKMQALFDLVEQVAPYDLPILIQGESGVGKERVADAVHYHSSRSHKPYLKINCAALSASLVESELFGHRKGAFTGASRDHKGFFEKAHGGTLLLDEIGDLPPLVQGKLLRVLQEGEVQRVGDERIQKVDVRIIAATNRSLSDAVTDGSFRQDLYYRLLGAILEVPPLRDRRQDIPLLAAHFLKQFGKQYHQAKTTKLSDQALGILLEHPWPGNVRELEHCLNLASIKAQRNGIIEPHHLENLTTHSGAGREPGSLSQLESNAIEKALTQTKGNISEAARILGINRSTLWRKLKKEPTK